MYWLPVRGKLMENTIKVLLADDHDMVRSGIANLLEENGEIAVVCQATDGKEALNQFTSCSPDVVVLDISMPEMDGLETCKRILGLDPEAKILILSMFDEERYAVRALRVGALGYITKQAGSNELKEAVVSVFHRNRYISDSAKDRILNQLIDVHRDESLMDSLSDREMQVLTFIAKGKKPKEIAEDLSLSVKTIDNYRLHIMTKLGLKRNAELVLFAHDHGLV